MSLSTLKGKSAWVLIGWTIVAAILALNGPDSGAAIAGFDDVDPNHFTEAFDLPKDAAKGAVLIVHERGTDRDMLGSETARPIPPDYADGAHDVDLGL